MDDSGPTIDPALNPGDVGPALTGPDPEAAIYTCPSCGGERAAHDFLSHDTQSYNECCSLCMSGWHAEALAMHHHPRQHGHDGTAAVDHALAMHEHEPMHGYTPQHTQHERYLSVRQLLADEAVGPQLGQDASSRGPLLRHGGGGGIGDGGMHGPDSHAMHEMPAGHAHTPLLGPPADMPGSSATTAALKAYHEMHAAGLIGFAFPQEIPSGLAGQQQDPAAGTPYHDMQAVSAATKQLADMTRDQPAIKQCSKCKTAKHLHDFPLLKGKSAGERGAQCCQCRGAVHRSQYQDMNSTGVVASDGEESERGEPHAAAATNVLANLYLPMVREKQCGHCGVVKPAAAFRRVRNKSDHLQSRCKVRRRGDLERKSFFLYFFALYLHFS